MVHRTDLARKRPFLLGVLAVLVMAGMGPSPAKAADVTKACDAARLNGDAAGLKACREAAESGTAVAQYFMGLMYANGDGVPRDRKAGFEWLKKAYVNDYPSAPFAIEALYPGRLKELQKAKATRDLVPENLPASGTVAKVARREDGSLVLIVDPEQEKKMGVALASGVDVVTREAEKAPPAAAPAEPEQKAEAPVTVAKAEPPSPPAPEPEPEPEPARLPEPEPEPAASLVIAAPVEEAPPAPVETPEQVEVDAPAPPEPPTPEPVAEVAALPEEPEAPAIETLSEEAKLRTSVEEAAPEWPIAPEPLPEPVEEVVLAEEAEPAAEPQETPPVPEAAAEEVTVEEAILEETPAEELPAIETVEPEITAPAEPEVAPETPAIEAEPEEALPAEPEVPVMPVVLEAETVAEAAPPVEAPEPVIEPTPPVETPVEIATVETPPAPEEKDEVLPGWPEPIVIGPEAEAIEPQPVPEPVAAPEPEPAPMATPEPEPEPEPAPLPVAEEAPPAPPPSTMAPENLREEEDAPSPLLNTAEVDEPAPPPPPVVKQKIDPAKTRKPEEWDIVLASQYSLQREKPVITDPNAQPNVSSVAKPGVSEATLDEPLPELEPIADNVLVASREIRPIAPPTPIRPVRPTQAELDAEAAKANVPAITEAWQVDLGIFSSPKAASSAWAILKQRHPKQLEGLVEVLEQAGRSSRLAAGPVESRAAALQICSAIRLSIPDCTPRLAWRDN